MLNTSGVEFLQLGAMAVLALYVAANLGANDVANSMGTSVGSKALTLRQAIIVAGILEFAGAVLFGQGVSQTLATGVVNAEVFVAKPQVFLIGMVSVLAACGLWLQIATSRGLPQTLLHSQLLLPEFGKLLARKALHRKIPVSLQQLWLAAALAPLSRSEERRVGKEC